MKLRVETCLIGLLAVSNVTLGVMLAVQMRKPAAPAEVYVDHLEQLHLAVATDGLLRARLGDSHTRTASTVAMTPGAALQLHYEMGRMFALIQQQANAVKALPAPESRDPTL